jgi:predicted nuclease of restriction endonuclease-like (RecB) superfamily
MSPNLVFRDQYLLGFLGLHDTYSERDLEEAILRELEGFIAELGTDFTFVGRQKRIRSTSAWTIDSTSFSSIADSGV